MGRESSLPGEAKTGAERARAFLGWVCLFAVIVLRAETVTPVYLEPGHQKFIFIIGLLGLWRYSNAFTHFFRGMYFMYWKFPRMRRAVDAMGDAALPSHMYMVVTSFRIPTHTTFKVYQSVFRE